MANGTFHASDVVLKSTDWRIQISILTSVSTIQNQKEIPLVLLETSNLPFLLFAWPRENNFRGSSCGFNSSVEQVGTGRLFSPGRWIGELSVPDRASSCVSVIGHWKCLWLMKVWYWAVREPSYWKSDWSGDTWRQMQEHGWTWRRGRVWTYSLIKHRRGFKGLRWESDYGVQKRPVDRRGAISEQFF